MERGAKRRQLSGLGKPNCFFTQGLLEKAMHFLEGKGKHIICCQYQDSLENKGVLTKWDGGETSSR